MTIQRLLILALLMPGVPGAAIAFDSGSTGAGGAFNPAASTQLSLPPDGVFHFTTVNIPTGVTVTFQRNAANTPVVILASGNVTIAGTLSVNGAASPATGAAGDGNQADDSLPGAGGPGGYDGGRGGVVGSNRRGGDGIGPGGGSAGDLNSPCCGLLFNVGGGGGGFNGTGLDARRVVSASKLGTGGAVYGASTLLPLVGGSGGGGGAGGTAFGGSGGGGGGGALLIVSSGTVTVTGTISANGGNSGPIAGAGVGANGGGGSGGAIRIVATTIAGNGTITASGGSFVESGDSSGGAGASGRIRLEAETITRTAGTTPGFSFAAPGSLFVAGLPRLSITSVAGVSVPADGSALSLPSNTPNPVTVAFATQGVPVGNTVTLTVIPPNAVPVTATSTVLAGTLDSATASANVNLPTGASVLSASISYTLTTAMGETFSKFAQGERVERVELTATAHGESLTTLVTVSGKRYTWPAKAIAGIAG